MKVYLSQNLSSLYPLDKFIGKDLWFALAPFKNLDHLGWYKILKKEDGCYYYMFLTGDTLAYMRETEKIDPGYVAKWLARNTENPRNKSVEELTDIYNKFSITECYTTAELFELADEEE